MPFSLGQGMVVAAGYLLATAVAVADTVEWIGPVEGDWSESTHWSTGTLPGHEDDVIAGDDDTIYVHHRVGDTDIQSLTLSGSLDLAGGTFAVSGPSTISAHLIVAPGAALAAEGAGASLTVSGRAYINGGTLIASGGAHIGLPSATHYSDAGLLRAVGPGSRIELSGLSWLGSIYADIPDLDQGISRVVSVYRGPLDSPNPLDDLAEAVSRSISVYRGPLDSADPLDDLAEAVSRSVSVYRGPLDSADPLDDLTEAVSRAVSVGHGTEED